MNDLEYEYHGLLASTWDLFRGDTSEWEDKFFYERIIAQYGQPVLDVGCGTGRLILDFLSTGIDIDGLDNSPEMLDICRKKVHSLGLQPDLYEQGMESFGLPRRYRTIIVPSLSLQLIVEKTLVHEAMDRFYAHLKVDGALVIPFVVFWEEGDPEELPWKMLAEEVEPVSGKVFRKWSYARFDGRRQLQHTEDRYEVLRNNKVIQSEHHKRSPALRWYTRSQALELYRKAGFERIQILRGFENEPASVTDTFFTIIGIK